MATIDRRLLPLIESLATVDADWLAFEILEGLRNGRVAQETREELQTTQHLVRSARRASRRSEQPSSPPPSAEPIIGDEQITWAASYVSERMSDLLSMLEATIAQLDAILFTPSLPEGRGEATLGDEVVLVLQTGQNEQLGIHRNDSARAKALFPKLQQALREWVDSTRTQG